MTRLIPPLNPLRAVEVVAKYRPVGRTARCVGRFIRAHPEIALNVLPILDPEAKAEELADVLILYGDGNWAKRCVCQAGFRGVVPGLQPEAAELDAADPRTSRFASVCDPPRRRWLGPAVLAATPSRGAYYVVGAPGRIGTHNIARS